MGVSESKVTIHMVSSLDGFISKPDGDVSWFDTKDTYEKGVTGEDVAEFMKTIDCFVMGARTYELALKLSHEFGWAYGDVPTVVLSHRSLPIERMNVQLYSGDVAALVKDRLKPAYKSIWIVGGAMLTQHFIQHKLADDIRLSIIPVILGGGMRFLDQLGYEQPLHLKDVTAYKTGMVELWYEIQRQQNPISAPS